MLYFLLLYVLVHGSEGRVFITSSGVVKSPASAPGGADALTAPVVSVFDCSYPSKSPIDKWFGIKSDAKDLGMASV